jgi:flagellar biosynthetic protein FliP
VEQRAQNGRTLSKVLKYVKRVTFVLCTMFVTLLATGGAAFAQQAPTPPTTDGAQAGINVTLPDVQGTGGGNTVVVILALTVLSIAPALLIMFTSFTRIVITLSLARQALGAQQTPPNQVIVGLAMMLSLIVMAPTFSKINEVAVQPLFKEEITIGEAVKRAEVPVRTFLLRNTRDQELSAMRKLAKEDMSKPAAETSFTALAPAFVLSELRTAFTLGFLIYLPFLVIDLVVASVLMSLGLMFLPPTFVSLPLKILLFVMLGGWTLIAETLVRSFA